MNAALQSINVTASFWDLGHDESVSYVTRSNHVAGSLQNVAIRIEKASKKQNKRKDANIFCFA